MNIKLCNGDCFDKMGNILDESIDLILTDPPYGTTACSWDIVIPFNEMWQSINRVIKPNGIVILFGSEPFSSLLRCSNLKDFRYDFIWIKNNCGNFQLSNKNPLKFHENISVFYKDIIHTEFSDIIQKCMKERNLSFKEVSDLCLSKNGNSTGWLSNKIKGTQIPTKEQWNKICELFHIQNEYDSIVEKLKSHTFNIEKRVTSIKRQNKNKGGSIGHFSSRSDTYIGDTQGSIKDILYYDRVYKPSHPTQKPVELLEYLIKIYSNENDTVLDFTMGSGSTGEACINTNRNFIGIERDKKYFNIAKKRIESCSRFFRPKIIIE